MSTKSREVHIEREADGIEYAVYKAQGNREGPISSPEQKASLSPILERAGLDSSSIDTTAYQQSIRIPTAAITDQVAKGAERLTADLQRSLRPGEEPKSSVVTPHSGNVSIARPTPHRSAFMTP